ncbi:MAG: hypothetical protein ABR579_04500 [Actinomycetota bacterium]
MQRTQKTGRLFGMRARRLVILAVALSLFAAGTARGAESAIHTSVIRSADAHWIVGPSGAGRVRYVDALYYEKYQDGSTRVLATIFMGTCRARSGSLTDCRTEKAVDQNDFEPHFVMDPLLQTASLDLGPNHVEWMSSATPQLTFLEVVCDPQDENQDQGPDLGRDASATGTLFGRNLASRANGSDYGFLTTGALVTHCAWSALHHSPATITK